MRQSNRPRPPFLVRIAVLAFAVATTIAPASVARAATCTVGVESHPDSPGKPADKLNGVEGKGFINVWAVGSSHAASKPLLDHYNGNRWRIVPAPDRGSTTELLDVTVVDRQDAWAVGYFTGADGHNKTLIERWNGSTWSIVPSPNPFPHGDNFLKGVSASSVTNVWAVGSNGRPGTKTIILRFD